MQDSRLRLFRVLAYACTEETVEYTATTSCLNLHRSASVLQSLMRPCERNHGVSDHILNDRPSGTEANQ